MIGNDDEKEIEDEGEAESDWDSLRCKSGESACERPMSQRLAGRQPTVDHMFTITIWR